MKTSILTILLLSIYAFAFAQERNVVLVVNHQLNAAPLMFNVPQVSSAGGMYRLTRFEYYVSGIEIIHDGGQVKALPNTYLLIDPKESNQFSLGSHTIEQIEGVRFSIGVDAVNNHADPTKWPFNHSLAPQDPNMHWGWEAGYRFVAVEGMAGPSENMLTTNFQVHTIGDELYTPVQVMTSGTYQNNEILVMINAEYANALTGIDVEQGPQNHGSEFEALTLIQNMGSNVFSPGTPSDVSVETTVAKMRAYPNPASGHFTIECSMPDNTIVVLRDMLGRQVASATLTNGRALMRLTELAAESYTAVANDGKNIQSTRVSVAP